jgi:hypothetical protein
MVPDSAAKRGLASLEWVRRETGFDADTVLGWVDGGTAKGGHSLRWAWDVSAAPRRDGSVRELRFLPCEVRALGHGSLAEIQGRDLDEVISDILGSRTRERFGAVEVANLLLVSRPHMGRLVESGQLSGHRAGHKQWLTRASLSEFFRARLVVPEITRKSTT